MKRSVELCLVGLVLLVLAGAAFNMLRSRHYYRYQGGRVWITDEPTTVFNGLREGPCLQFEVPAFAIATSWKPTPEQIRLALAKSGSEIKEEEITRIIRECVSIQERDSR